MDYAISNLLITSRVTEGKIVKKFILAILLSAFIAAPAFAADARYYAGLKVGSVTNSVPGTSESSTSFGVFGGYTINPNFAVELGYTDLGSVVSGTITFSSLELSAVGTYPINDQWSLYGKLGMASTTETGLGSSVSRSDVTYGIGGNYKLNPTTDLRFGLDRYGFGDDVTFVKGDSSSISVGAVFKF